MAGAASSYNRHYNKNFQDETPGENVAKGKSWKSDSAMVDDVRKELKDWEKEDYNKSIKGKVHNAVQDFIDEEVYRIKRRKR